jgi:hypothetical protein
VPLWFISSARSEGPLHRLHRFASQCGFATHSRLATNLTRLIQEQETLGIVPVLCKDEPTDERAADVLAMLPLVQYRVGRWAGMMGAGLPALSMCGVRHD